MKRKFSLEEYNKIKPIKDQQQEFFANLLSFQISARYCN